MLTKLHEQSEMPGAVPVPDRGRVQPRQSILIVAATPGLAICRRGAKRRAVDRGAAVQGTNRARARIMIDLYLPFVARVLRNAGTPAEEIDGELERTFIVATARLDAIRPGAEKGFLFRTALRRAAHMRRTMERRLGISIDGLFERSEPFPTPEQLTDPKRMRQTLDRILDRLDQDGRAIFVLHEFEEMTVSEIAGVLKIPRRTVASRLLRARAAFRHRVAVLESLSRHGTRRRRDKSPMKH
jgi:RNA polymerase sigma-70 factor (ECF subfamily)